jgi:hypothetical protein
VLDLGRGIDSKGTVFIEAFPGLSPGGMEDWKVAFCPVKELGRWYKGENGL